MSGRMDMRDEIADQVDGWLPGASLTVTVEDGGFVVKISGVDDDDVNMLSAFAHAAAREVIAFSLSDLIHASTKECDSDAFLSMTVSMAMENFLGEGFKRDIRKQILISLGRRRAQ